MALRIPDITIVNTINMILKMLRSDYKKHVDAGHEHRSLLYLLFKTVKIGKYDFYENIKTIINTTPESPKHIEAQLAMDHNAQQDVPIVWIMLPSENNRNNSIGLGEGNQNELLLANDDGQDAYVTQYNYRWATTYQVIIASQNRNETIALYHVIKAMLVTCIGHFDVEGLSNMKIGGGDVRLHQLPSSLYTKAIVLNFEYEQTIPESYAVDIYRKLRIFWKPEGAEVAYGPIEIQNEDTLESDYESES